LGWAFALIVGVLSVFTITPATTKPATTKPATTTPDTTTPTTTTAATISPESRSVTFDALLAHAKPIWNSGAATSRPSNNPEGSDIEHGPKFARPGITNTVLIAAQQARFYFLVTSFYQTPYSPRSPPTLA
jgi:hypothetical protein